MQPDVEPGLQSRRTAAAIRTLREELEDHERQVILAAVRAHDGNWAAAARALGMHRSNLHHRATKLGLRETR